MQRLHAPQATPAFGGHPTARPAIIALLLVARARRATGCRAASTFAALGIDARVCSALAAQGVSAPTEIQVKAAAPLLARKNTLIASETGSGKTVAYLAPLLHNLLVEAGNDQGDSTRRVGGRRRVGPRLLVLTPNRTLCAQVERVADSVMRAGGLPLTCSARAMLDSGRRHNGGSGERESAPTVVVSSPRALLPPGVTPSLSQLTCVVMDEGDLLLRDGYVKDVALLLEETRRQSGVLPQLVVVAASLWPTGGTVWNKAVRRSALKKLLKTMDRAVSDGLHRRTTGLEERVVWVNTPDERWPTLVSLVRSFGPQAHMMVFVVAPAEADATARHLRDELPGEAVDITAGLDKGSQGASKSVGISPAAKGVWRVGAFHAKRSRAEQAQALAQFGEDTAGLGCVLVCTDALSRGVDMARPVDVVVQLGPAESGSAHLHRVGRTARQGQKGIAVTIACHATEGDAARVAAGQRAVLQDEEEEDQQTSLASSHARRSAEKTRAIRAAGRALETKAERRRARKAKAASSKATTAARTVADTAT